MKFRFLEICPGTGRITHLRLGELARFDDVGSFNSIAAASSLTISLGRRPSELTPKEYLHILGLRNQTDNSCLREFSGHDTCRLRCVSHLQSRLRKTMNHSQVRKFTLTPRQAHSLPLEERIPVTIHLDTNSAIDEACSRMAAALKIGLRES